MIGSPFTYSIAKYGRPFAVSPPSSTFAMFGWFITASAWRSCSNRATTCFELSPRWTSLSATRCTNGCRRSASHTVPNPPSPIGEISL